MINITTPNLTNTFFVKADSSSSEWIEQSSSTDWSDRRGHCCYEKDGTLFISGGQNASEFFSDIWKSTDNGESWTLVTDTAPFGQRYNHFVLELSGTLFLFGGSFMVECSDVWSSEDGESWTLVTASWNISGLRAFGACVHNNKLCIAGGYKVPNVLIYSDSFWTSEDGAVWTEVSSNIGLPLDAFNINTPLFSFNGILYVLSHGEIHKSIDNGLTWSTTVDGGVSLSPVLARAITNGNSIYVSGGYDAEITTQLSDKLWTSEDGIVWTQQVMPCGKRYAHGVFLNSNGFTICGGASSNSPMVYENDIWVLLYLHHYIQCPVAEAEGIAVLRYIPVGADSVEGEVYANGTALKRMRPITITFTAIGITAIDIFVKKHSSETWLQVGKSLDTSGGTAQFRLLPSDFVVGDIIDIKLKDVDTDISAIAESLEILPSFTLDVYPVGAKALESAQTFSGTGLSGKLLTITLTSGVGEKVVTTTPVAEVWSEDIALTTGDGFDSGDSVNVEISRTTYDQKDYGVLYSVVGTLVLETGVAPFITRNIELDSAFNVSVASSLEGKNIIIEAQLAGGDWSSVTQIGTGMVTEGIALVSCTVPEDDFDANDSIEVRARYGTLASVAESLSVIATLTIDRPTLTESVEGNVTGTSNGDFVDVFWSVANLDEWHIFAENVEVDENGDYTAVGVGPAQGYKDFKAEDTTDPAGYARVDDVVVASGYTEAKFMLVGNSGAGQYLKYSDDTGANWTSKGAVTAPYTKVKMNEDGKYGIAVNSNGVYIIVNGTMSTAINTAKTWNDCAISKTGQYMMAVWGDTSGTSGEIRFSTDYGSNWTTVQSSLSHRCCAMSEDGQYMCSFIYAGKAVFSSDYGSNWTSRGSTNKNWITCCMSKAGDYVYAISSTTEGVQKYTSNGATIATIFASGDYNDVSCDGSGLKVVGCRYNNYIHYSSNAGSSYSNLGSGGYRRAQISGDGNYIIARNNATDTVTVAQSPFSSWTSHSLSGENVYISYSGQYMLAVHTNSIYKSSNYGVNFATVGLASAPWVVCALNTKR